MEIGFHPDGITWLSVLLENGAVADTTADRYVSTPVRAHHVGSRVGPRGTAWDRVGSCAWDRVGMGRVRLDGAPPTRVSHFARSGGGRRLTLPALFTLQVAALYWSVMTMTTVGYGDVHAQNAGERGYAIFCMMLGALAFAYLLGNTQNLLANLEQTDNDLQRKKDGINAFMRYRNLSNDLQDRIRSYYSFHWSRQNVFDEAQILAGLPVHLRKEVALTTNRKIITAIPFFESADDSFVSEVVLRLQPIQAAAGDWLIRAGEIGSEMYIVDSGQIEIVSPSGRQARHSPEHDHDLGIHGWAESAGRLADCLPA